MRKRDPNKEKLIREEAMRMMVAQGFDGFSMQKLAKAASVSPATLYIYFKDREDLILQLSAEENKKMAAATLENFDPMSPFSEGLKIQWLNRARYCIQHPESMHFLEQIRNSPLKEKSMKLMGNEFREALETFVKNSVKRKELVALPLEVYWSIAFAPLYTLVHFHMSGTSIGGNKFSFS